jgi:hypothetical protein
MIRRVWNQIGPVAGLLALFVALDGPAWASSMINGATIKPSTVTGKQVRNSSLTGADVRNSSLTGADVKNATLDGRDVKDGSLAGTDVTDGSIDDRDIKDGSLTGTEITDGSLTGADVSDGSIKAGDLAPGVIPAAPSLSIPDGSITTAKFADSAVAPTAKALPGLRTEQNATSPNIIGGADGNSVTSGVVGALLGGGGASSVFQSITDDFGTIGGGRGNTAGDGAGTTSDALGATVGGGEGNTATGQYATIPGGVGNSAAAFSMAAGRRAKAVNTGSFVWADSMNANFTSTADNQFAIRAANGMSIASDAGNGKDVPIGTRYRDNAIVAWARVTATGTADSNFNVASVTKVSTGRYSITLNSGLQSGFSLIPTVTPEIDPEAGNVVPVGAANVRLAATNQLAGGSSFEVFIYNGSFALVDNDFQVMVTGR